jgi:hypothetical protein
MQRGGGGGGGAPVSPMLLKNCSREGSPSMPVLIPARTTQVWISPSVASYASAHRQVADVA